MDVILTQTPNPLGPMDSLLSCLSDYPLGFLLVASEATLTHVLAPPRQRECEASKDATSTSIQVPGQQHNGGIGYSTFEQAASVRYATEPFHATFLRKN